MAAKQVDRRGIPFVDFILVCNSLEGFVYNRRNIYGVKVLAISMLQSIIPCGNGLGEVEVLVAL